MLAKGWFTCVNGFNGLSLKNYLQQFLEFSHRIYLLISPFGYFSLR